MNTKSEIRKEFRIQRKKLTSAEVQQFSAKITHLLFSRIPIHRYSVVHVFLPILKNNEPNSYLILEKLLKDFPADIYISKSLENGEMLHVLYNSATILEENKWGIPEPKNVDNALNSESFFEKYKKEEILVLIPLLAFDKKGNRIGYGKGYYDRFLAYSGQNCTKIGISFLESVEEIIDSESTDIQMDFCVSPQRIYKF